jgi:WD40 repeat protein
MLPSCSPSHPYLVSAARDSKVKLWDLTTRSCSATLKLPVPCQQLLPGFDLGPCLAATTPGIGVLVLDPRSPNPVARLPTPHGRVTCAVAHQGLVAAATGHRAFAWDVRQVSSGVTSSVVTGASLGTSSDGGWGGGSSCRWGRSGGSSSRSCETLKPLFKVALPRNQQIAHLHLDRLKLVAATGQVLLHCGSSMGVWSSEDGRQLANLSCT